MTARDLDGSVVEPVRSIEHIKARADIIDIMGVYMQLKRSGRDYWAKCPLHDDRTPSLQVSPLWQNYKCWGCGAAGDAVDFIMAAEKLPLSTALERLRELVGGGAPGPGALAAQVARRASADAQASLASARNTGRARQILAESESLTMRTGGLPVQYLVERRGITQWQPYTLRWHPRCPWGQERTGCIVVPVENYAGEVTGVWRIRPAMEGKIERLGLGPVKGCFAPVIDHAAQPVLVIAEGVEDALAAWVLTTYPAWAALSAGNMKVLELPPQFEQVIICADAEPQGRAAGVKLARRLRAEGREARVIEPIAGKDANDVLRAQKAG